jgi:hypothetical protein
MQPDPTIPLTRRSETIVVVATTPRGSSRVIPKRMGDLKQEEPIERSKTPRILIHVCLLVITVVV